MQRTALVTGGAGFIGSHLVERLVRENWRVRILDDLSTGSLENLKNVESQIDFTEGDVCNFDVCSKSCTGVFAVFHLAAIASVQQSVEDPRATHAVTLGGTVNLLEAARHKNVRRFVLSSSAAVYGNVEAVPTREDQNLNPQSPYATAKAASEMYCRNFAELYGIEAVVLRYFNIFGERQPANSSYAAAIPKFIEAALMRRRPTVYGDGKQTRDFVHVSNVVEANFLAATSAAVGGKTFNIGCGRQIDLLELLDQIAAITGTQVAPNHVDQRAGEVRHSRADISNAVRSLGFHPSVSLEDGLRRTIASASSVTDGALYAA